MPDISMCSNRVCPRRSGCYRYRAIPTPHRQSYIHPVEKPCIYYTPILRTDRIRPIHEADQSNARTTEDTD